MRTVIIATLLSAGLLAAPAAFAASAAVPCTDRNDPKCASVPAAVKDNKAQTPAQKQMVKSPQTKGQKSPEAQTKGQDMPESQAKDPKKPVPQPKK